MSASNPKAASPLKEFAAGRQAGPRSRPATPSRSILERMEDKNGEAQLSREKARREEAWTLLEKSFQANERVTGTIFGRVKGGFTVDLNGAVAFLPGSQVDIRPVRDITPLLGSPQPFQILKMDRSRGNIVVSRRAVLEESRAEAALGAGRQPQGRPDPQRRRQEHHRLRRLRRSRRRRRPAARHRHRLAAHQPSVRGAPYRPDRQGAGHPLQPRDAAHLARHEAARGRSVGGRRAQIPGRRASFKGRVTNITDYGAFVELEPGVEGLVHVSEMSWTKKNVHPGKIVSTSQEVEVHGARCRSAEAPHQPRPQADAWRTRGRPSPRSTRSAASSRARSATSPSSACSSACPATSTAWCISPTSTGTAPARRRSTTTSKGEHGAGQGARRRCREGAHQPRHQAARGRSVRSRAWPS